MSDTIKWWPEHYCDEVMPAGLASPSDWIRGRVDNSDVWMIGPKEIDGWALLRISQVDIVPFVSCTYHGTFDLTFDDAGGYKISGDVPPGANTFWCNDDSETFATSLEDMITFLREYDVIDVGWPINIACGEWSKFIPHRLVVENGAARFVAIETGGEA